MSISSINHFNIEFIRSLQENLKHEQLTSLNPFSVKIHLSVVCDDKLFSYNKVVNPLEKKKISEIVTPIVDEFLTEQNKCCTRIAYSLDIFIKNNSGKFSWLAMKLEKNGSDLTYGNKVTLPLSKKKFTNLVVTWKKTFNNEDISLFDSNQNFIE